MPGRLTASVIAALLAAGCAKASEEVEVRRTPVPPPPPSTTIPDALQIAVMVDGAAAAPVTAALLGATPPDFADDERRAWRLTRLLPALDAPGAVVEARGPDGIAVRIPRPPDAASPQPVLFLTRRGDAVVSVVEPDDPFPRYHGQGGRLRRQGDPLPRLSPVSELRVHTAP